MNKHPPIPKTKLVFNKEKIASLSPADLDEVRGGEAFPTDSSTRADFTCTLCTTITEQAE